MDFYGHIIDGEEVPSLDGATMPDIDPFTREQWATVACGGKADADRAVAAARKAFDEGPWPRMGYEKRQAIMHRLADLMDEHADELAMADNRFIAGITCANERVSPNGIGVFVPLKFSTSTPHSKPDCTSRVSSLKPRYR